MLYLIRYYKINKIIFFSSSDKDMFIQGSKVAYKNTLLY